MDDLDLALTSARYVNIELLEAGISRIWQFVQSGKPFAMITAFRGGFTREQNHKRNEKLMSQLRGFGYGGIQLNGYYQEQGMSEPHKELSFFVPLVGRHTEPEFRSQIAHLCAAFNQECVGYSDGERFGLLFPNGKFEPMFKSVSFSPDKVKNAWSRLRGKTFVMVEAAYCDGSNMTKYLWDHLGLIPAVPYKTEALRKASAAITKAGNTGIVGPIINE